MASKPFRVRLKTLDEISVVPAVTNGLHQHAMADAEFVHLFYQEFDGCSDGRRLEVWLVGMCERKSLRVAAPDVHVGVDDRRFAGALLCRRCRHRAECNG